MMDILVKRLPLKDHIRLLMDYWINHIQEWKMKPEDIIYFANDAMSNLWIYAAFQNSMCCGILVNEENIDNTIWLFHVLPSFRNLGIGTLLYQRALQNIRGIWNAGIGTGYWWQGVPLGCGDDFLEKRGFNWSWTSIDMILSLDEWTRTNVNVEVDIDNLKPHEGSSLISMLEAEEDLSGWTGFYNKMIQDLEYDKILVARADNIIVGCVMVLEEKSIRWRGNINGRVGGIGCIGVRKMNREHGIGTSLVSAVNDRLKLSGYTHSYVGYTWLENWYGKMGYEVFCRQRMGCGFPANLFCIN